MRARDPGGGSWCTVHDEDCPANGNWSGSMEILHNLSSSQLTMNGAGRREFRIQSVVG